jgi:hypothetical protein
LGWQSFSVIIGLTATVAGWQWDGPWRLSCC